jgi:hypothetical protein
VYTEAHTNPLALDYVVVQCLHVPIVAHATIQLIGDSIESKEQRRKMDAA